MISRIFRRRRHRREHLSAGQARNIRDDVIRVLLDDEGWSVADVAMFFAHRGHPLGDQTVRDAAARARALRTATREALADHER